MGVPAEEKLTGQRIPGSTYRAYGRQLAMNPQPSSQTVSVDALGILASEVLKDFYRAVTGHEAEAVRSYRDEDAVLLLVRFDPTEIAERDSDELLPHLDTAFHAIPAMVASAVEARTGQRLAPGNLSVCVGRGLAVFAFSALDEPAELESDEDIFRIDAAPGAASARQALRLAS